MRIIIKRDLIKKETPKIKPILKAKKNADGGEQLTCKYGCGYQTKSKQDLHMVGSS